MKGQLNISTIVNSLQKNLELSLSTFKNNDGYDCLISNDYTKNEGFVLIIKPYFSKIKIFFDLEKNAGFLFNQIKSKISSNTKNLNLFISSFSNDLEINFITDDTISSLEDLSEIKFKKFNFELIIDLEEQENHDLNSLLLRSLTDCLRIIIFLTGLEKSDETDFNNDGNISIKKQKYYERKIENRLICLNTKGFNCYVCGFNFEKKYGEIGKEFIHVHHVLPASKITTEFNPIEDLIPVCPNCHSMLHKEDPPIDPDILKSIIKKN